MNYNKPFFINQNKWNNSFSFDKVKNKKIYVPNLIDIDIWDLDKIELQNDKNKVAFQDIWFDWKMSINHWLKNFYRIKYDWKEIILFDNHNHAFYFWFEAKKKWIILDNSKLIHIDEHADTRDNQKYLLKPESDDLQKVFDFTNYELNVGDYIIPAQKQWLIWDIVQIRSTSDLEKYLSDTKNIVWDIILNLDLDFFRPDLDFIDFDLKKKVILDVAKKAKLITVSTSPFFIDQDLAVKVFKDIFW